MSRYDFVREEAILDDLLAKGRVTVNDLATRLGVSAVTVRKDLDLLEQRSLLRRVRGGAVASAPREEDAFESRLRTDAAAKRAIARAACELVSDGDVIAIDSSSTTYYLAKELINRTGLVIVTNGIRLASLLMERSDATVILPGGVLRRASGSVVGAFSDVLEGRGRVKTGFFGVSSVSRSLGLLELSTEECEAKRGLARSCDSVIGLFSAAKASGFGLHAFADPGQITAMYTDDAVGSGFAESWHGSGVDIAVVPVERNHTTESSEVQA